jgi:RNA polymerase II-associated factor 1
MSQDEEEREEAVAEIADPMFLLARDAHADGDIEVDYGGFVSGVLDLQRS